MAGIVDIIQSASHRHSETSGDRVLLHTVPRQPGVMAVRPRGGDFRVQVGDEVIAVLVLEEAAYAVCIAVEPDGNGGFACALLDNGQTLLNGSNRIAANSEEAEGEDYREMLLENPGLAIRTEHPGKHDVGVVLSSKPVPTEISNRYDPDDSRAYCDALAKWIEEQPADSVKKFRRQFTAE